MLRAKGKMGGFVYFGYGYRLPLYFCQKTSWHTPPLVVDGDHFGVVSLKIPQISQPKYCFWFCAVRCCRPWSQKGRGFYYGCHHLSLSLSLSPRGDSQSGDHCFRLSGPKMFSHSQGQTYFWVCSRLIAGFLILPGLPASHCHGWELVFLFQNQVRSYHPTDRARGLSVAASVGGVVEPPSRTVRAFFCALRPCGGGTPFRRHFGNWNEKIPMRAIHVCFSKWLAGWPTVFALSPMWAANMTSVQFLPIGRNDKFQ